MIQLYRAENTNFETNGDIILQPTSCIVTAGLNRTWQVDMEHPIDEEGRWEYIVADAVIKCPSFNGIQLWRIVQTEKRDTGIVAVCDPIFYDAAHEVVIIDRVTLNNTTPEAAFNALAEGSRFSIVSDITEEHSVWYQTENIVEILTGADHGFAHTWDAELGFNNYEVQVMSELGGDYGAAVLYGKNLAVDGIAESVNIDGTITRIIPIAYNGYMLPEVYVDSPLIDNYPFPRIGIINYDNLRLWADRQEGEEGTAETEYYNSLEELYAAMRAKANEEYSVNEIDRLTVGLEVDMVLIQNTEEYKDYKDLETVSIGDYVRCYNPRLGIDSKTRVRTIQYDAVREAVTYVELGKEKRNYFDNVTSIMNAAERAIRPDGTVIAEQVQGFIDGALAQLRLQNTIAKKQDVRAILFEDLDPNSPTFGAMALGTQGFQISRQRTQDGREWDWTTSATAAGIIANTIVAGLLTDKLGKNYWNLDTGDFSLQGATITNSTVDGYATDTELQNAVDDLQSQIDGKVDTWFYSGAPALNKPPVTYDGSDPDTGWDTDEKKRNHIGDVYYDTTNGYAYRFIYESGAFSWMLIQDSDVMEALETAREALALADKKMRVFITQPTPPYKEGDIYFVGANGDILTCIRARATGRYNASDWAKRNKYIDTAQANTLINTFNQSLDQQAIFNKLTNNGQTQGIYLQDGKIYINGEYIKAGVISGITIEGNTINGGTINGTNINGSNITGTVIHNEDVSVPYQRSDFDINEATATSKDTIYSDEERTTVIQEYKSIQRRGQFVNDYIHYDEEGNIDEWTRGRMGGGAIELTELNADEELIGSLQLSMTLYNMQYPRLSYGWRLPGGVLRYVDYFPAFRPEESVRFGVGPYAGHVTNAGKDLVFWIPYFKSADGMNVDTITLPTTLTVRGTQGYLNSGSISGSTLKVASFDNRMGGLQVALRQKNGNAFTNVTNNTPVSVVFSSGYLTATYKLYEN